MPRHEIIIMTGKWTREFGMRYEVDADTPRRGFLKYPVKSFMPYYGCETAA
jgi:hypothetical protein